MRKNLLTLSINVWSDENSIGNTMSNWFSNWHDWNISNIYMREGIPNNCVCERYFQITEKMLLLNLLTPKKIGRYFNNAIPIEKMQYKYDLTSENWQEKIKNFINKHNVFAFLYKLQKILWSTKLWENQNLRKFILDEKPDIVFSFAMPSVQYLYLLEYIKRLTDCKIVTYIPDNVYPEFSKCSNKGDKRKAKIFEKILSLSDCTYAASMELSNVYGKKFKQDIPVLYKGAVFDHEVRTAVNCPLKITYAGNLLFGRLNTIIMLAENINKINKNGIQIVLEIYSGTQIDVKQQTFIESNQGCYFLGKEKYENIKNILHQSDIVLHLESFNEEEIDKVKFSFSTKILDCLQSGSTMLVIGPKNISSVEYSRQIPGTIVIDDTKEILCALKNIVANPKQLIEKAQKTRLFALENHKISIIHQKMQNDFINLTLM